jgi:hypothetical protein
VGRLSRGYRVRAEFALGADSVISAFSEALDLPGPSLLALDPFETPAVRGWEGSPTMDLNLSGSHFQPGAVAYWGTCPLATTYTSSTALLAGIPMDSLVRCSGTMPITVANPGGSVSDALTFTILYAGPLITSLTPDSADGGGLAFPLQLDGCDFQSGVQVNWYPPNWVVIPLGITSESSTRIIAQVPSEALYYSGDAWVEVVNPGGGGGWASFYVRPMLTPSRPPSTLAPDGGPQPRRNPPGTLRRGPSGATPSRGRLAPSQTRGGNSP